MLRYMRQRGGGDGGGGRGQGPQLDGLLLAFGSIYFLLPCAHARFFPLLSRPFTPSLFLLLCLLYPFPAHKHTHTHTHTHCLILCLSPVWVHTTMLTLRTHPPFARCGGPMRASYVRSIPASHPPFKKNCTCVFHTQHAPPPSHTHIHTHPFVISPSLIEELR